MKELIDKDEGIKLMATIVCKIVYDDQSYLFYTIKRSEKEVNLFISKLMKNSDGYVISHDFVNGEKDVLDKVVQRIINMESIISLEKDGFSLDSDISLIGDNYFDIKSCYVATVSADVMKVCSRFYHFSLEDDFQKPRVRIEKEKQLNKGFVVNAFIILLGIVVILLGIGVIIRFLVR